MRKRKISDPTQALNDSRVALAAAKSQNAEVKYLADKMNSEAAQNNIFDAFLATLPQPRNAT